MDVDAIELRCMVARLRAVAEAWALDGQQLSNILGLDPENAAALMRGEQVGFCRRTELRARRCIDLDQAYASVRSEPISEWLRACRGGVPPLEALQRREGALAAYRAEWRHEADRGAVYREES